MVHTFDSAAGQADVSLVFIVNSRLSRATW